MEELQNRKILICGAGHQGLAMAAHLALSGELVYMWNRSQENIDEICKDNMIECKGVVNGVAHIQHISTDVKEVIQKVILITTPSIAHKYIAKRLAPYITSDMYIILNPGRTFGAIEFAETLLECGVKELPHIAETQSIIYTCRKNSANSVTIYAFKNNIAIASLADDCEEIIEHIPKNIRDYYSPVESVLETSLPNVGMILHCAPVLMNIGWIESEKVDFKYYYDGISPSVASYLEKMDKEKRLVAEKLGYKIESVTEWLQRIYAVEGKSLYECLNNNEAYSEIDAPPSLECRYLDEDIPNGLVPYEYLAKDLQIEVPHISTIIDLAELVTNKKYREFGRKYSLEDLKRYE